MPDVVWSNLKPDLEPCVCGCETVARPRTKAWADGLGPHARGCPCRRCLGSRSNKGGHRKQGKALRGIGAPRAVRNEENIGGTLRTEVKSGATAQPVWTKFLASEKQSEQNRPRGDGRPFVAVFMPEGTSDGLVVFRLSNLAETVQALYEQCCEDA